MATCWSIRRIYDAMLKQLQAEGGYLVDEREKALLEKAYWDADGHRTPDTIARAAAVVAAKAGFSIPEDKTFLMVEEQHIGKEHRFSTEKLGTVLTIFKYRRLRRRARDGPPDLRNRRQGPFLWHLFIR